jgi:soluble lytic murein transglycosylase
VVGERPEGGCSRALTWLLASAVAALAATDAFSAQQHKLASPHRGKAAHAVSHKHSAAAQTKRGKTARQHEHERKAHEDVSSVPLPRERPTAASLPPDFALAKQAIELVRGGKWKDATALAGSIGDPAARKLVEWLMLRHSDSQAAFEHYVAFISANPDWPSVPLFRRRAEARLWKDRRDADTVRRFVGAQPTSSVGRLALARVLLSEGDRDGAAREVRAVWQAADLSTEMEAAVLDTFGALLTSADHVVRMDRRIGAKDFGSATRAAKHVGDDQVAIVKACAGVEAKSAKGGALLDAVKADARDDLGYKLCRLQWLLRNDAPGLNVHGRIVTPKKDITAAADLALSATQEDLRRQDTDEWWRQRRALARKLIDVGEAETAYKVVCESAPPANPYYRAEFHFMAGWIALRFLSDPEAALEHFAHVDDGSVDPIVLARAAYWRGRAAETAGQFEEMRRHYRAAARYPTAYYGQLARAKLGLSEIALRDPPSQSMSDSAEEMVHAADILYEIGERDLAATFMSDVAEESGDAVAIAALGQLAGRRSDARAMLLVGKTALARGLPMDQYAFPDIGVPLYNAVGPALDRSIVYSIVRTESAFDQRDMSSANAVGLMQVTPGAARDTARRFGVTYDWKRLVSDPAYNTQMGAAELASLLKEYRGSYVMAFAGYNAGRGRVQQWVAQHGDPRDPKIDMIDWIERIPFAETRNYVQRVVENLQVYRARFGADAITVDPKLYRPMIAEANAEPTFAESMPLDTGCHPDDCVKSADSRGRELKIAEASAELTFADTIPADSACGREDCAKPVGSNLATVETRAEPSPIFSTLVDRACDGERCGAQAGTVADVRGQDAVAADSRWGRFSGALKALAIILAAVAIVLASFARGHRWRAAAAIGNLRPGVGRALTALRRHWASALPRS